MWVGSRDTAWTRGQSPGVWPKLGKGGGSPSEGLPAEREPRVGGQRGGLMQGGQPAKEAEGGGGQGQEGAGRGCVSQKVAMGGLTTIYTCHPKAGLEGPNHSIGPSQQVEPRAQGGG